MEDLLKNKLFWVVVLLAVFNLGFYAVGRVLVDKTADRVIEKLQKDYSPSPYGPGLDPDKVDPDGLTGLKVKHDEIEYIPLTESATSWREGWERDRGVSPGL